MGRGILTQTNSNEARPAVAVPGEVMEALVWLFESRQYMPHGYCYTWQPSVLWMHVGSNALIAASYFAIPITLYAFVRRRRRELPFPWLGLLFAAFILLCGLTHAFGIWTIWYPAYRLEGLVMLATGIVSVTTAVALVQVMPQALALRGPAELQREVEARTAELTRLNRRLQEEASAREAAVAALVESERRFQLATRAVRGFIYETDRETHAVTRSEGFADVVGVAPEAASPTIEWWLGRVHPADLERLREAERDLDAATDATNAVVDLEYRVRHRDGRWIWLWDRAVAAPPEAGRARRVIGSVVDITDRKLAEQERDRLLTAERDARAAAEAANRAKEQFLATLSHELRTPLSTILLWARIIATRPDDGEQVRRAADVIDQNARAQSQLVSDLLDMARIDAGKMRLDVQRVDLATVIDAALASVEPAAAAKGLRLDRIVEPVEPILGDPARLQQVLWNLLSNAVKFTPKGGRVIVTLARVHSHLELAVSDTGQGVPAEFLPHLFSRFSQADGSATREHGGLGLGLAIVKHLAELHGGQVRATSPGPGQGSTFTLELPLLPLGAGGRHPSAEPLNGAPAFDAPRLDGLSVLLVDDRDDALAGIAALLRDAGAIVTTAGSGAEGLARLAQASIDLLIIDVGMPGMDGYEFLAAARAAGYRAPALALTAYVRAEDRSRARVAGFDAHLGKPVDPTELLATLAALAGRPGAR